VAHRVTVVSTNNNPHVEPCTDYYAELAIAFFDLTTLFLLTQTKAQNIPLYFLFRLQYFFLSKLPCL
jgi:hypothetical protein